jgi:F-type H+-transporting ATPase subunit b
MEIIPDLVQVLLNTLPFLTTVLGMHYIVFRPMINYLEARDEAIHGGRAEAEVIEEKICQRMDDYEQRLAAARTEVTALRAARRVEAQAAYAEVVSGARAEADAKVAQVVGEIAAARDAASAQLKGVSGEIADQVAGQVLGRPIARASS